MDNNLLNNIDFSKMEIKKPTYGFRYYRGLLLEKIMVFGSIGAFVALFYVLFSDYPILFGAFFFLFGLSVILKDNYIRSVEHEHYQIAIDLQKRMIKLQDEIENTDIDNQK